MSELNSLNTEYELPVIAIVGRPNVGKSTLFNRLIRRRRSITDPAPGVTRDLIEETYLLNGKPVKLVDSGGATLRHEGFDDLVTEKSLQIIKRADVVVLLLDVHEITPEDEMLIEAVRPRSQQLVVAVNKVDHEVHEKLIWEAYRFGFNTIVPISAEHGRGIVELEEEMYKLIDFSQISLSQPEGPKTVRIAVMGKPNTGKSTLINRLLGRDVSIVSDIPGTTRDTVTGEFEHRGTAYQVTDTAGIRRKSRVAENVEYYSVTRAVSAIDQSDVVLLLMDSADGLVDQDKKIASLITKKGKGLILVLNKWDLMEGIPNQLRAVRDRVRFLFPVVSFAPLLPISAQQGSGIDVLMKTVDQVYEQLSRRVETSALNSALEAWTQRHEPPRDSKGRYKILYGTQVRTNPVEFVLFVNRKDKFPKEYLGYITNGIRKELGFDLIPLRVELRERKRRGGR